MAVQRNTTHRLTQLLRQVRAVAPLDPEIDRLRNQFTAFERSAGTPKALDLLAEAVTSGDLDAQPVLFAASLAELAGTAPATAEVVTQIQLRVNRKIWECMAQTGPATYAAVATQFDQAAAKMVDTYNAVAVEADAELAVDLPDRQRKLWKSAPDLAADLDRLAAALHCAAVLARYCDDTPEAEILVCVDSNGIDPKTLKELWDTVDTQRRNTRAAANNHPFTGKPPAETSRCGRWSALLQAGATIRALDVTKPAAALEPA